MEREDDRTITITAWGVLKFFWIFAITVFVAYLFIMHVSHTRAWQHQLNFDREVLELLDKNTRSGQESHDAADKPHWQCRI